MSYYKHISILLFGHPCSLMFHLYTGQVRVSGFVFNLPDWTSFFRNKCHALTRRALASCAGAQE